MTLWMSYISFAILLLISKYAILDAYLARCPSFWHPESSGTGLSHHLPFPNFCLPFPSSQFPCIHIPTWHAPSPPPAKKILLCFHEERGSGPPVQGSLLWGSHPCFLSSVGAAHLTQRVMHRTARGEQHLNEVLTHCSLDLWLLDMSFLAIYIIIIQGRKWQLFLPRLDADEVQ